MYCRDGRMQTEEGMAEGPECLLVFGKVESILFNFVAAYCFTLNLNNTEHICTDGMCLIRESLLRIFFIVLAQLNPSPCWLKSARSSPAS